MDFLMNLIQLGLDAGILALCCEVVFRQRAEIKAKDFFIFPILLVLCVVPRVDFSVGANMTASFRSEGFEILPADNIVALLFLIFAVLLLSSIFFGSKSSGTVFCGTMAASSIFLFVKCLCAVLFCCLRSYGYFTPVGQPYSGVVPYSRTGVHAAFRLDPSARPKKRFHSSDRICQYRCPSHGSAFYPLFLMWIEFFPICG